MDLRNRIHNSRAHEPQYNFSQSTIDSESFQKVDSVKKVIIGGSCAEILYKKPEPSLKKAKSQSNEKVKLDNFVSDGGLKDRSMKYKDSTTFNKPSPKIPKSSSDFNYTGYQISMYSSSVKVMDSQEKDRTMPKEAPVVLKNKNKSLKEVKEVMKIENTHVESPTKKKIKAEKRSVSEEVKKKVSSTAKKETETINHISEHSISQAKNKQESPEGQVMQNNYISTKTKLKKVNPRNHESSKDSEHEDRPKKTLFIEASREKKVSQPKVNDNEVNKESLCRLAPKAMPEQSMNNPPINQGSKQHSRVNDQSMSLNVSKMNATTGKFLSEQERIEIMEKLVKNKEEEIIRDVQKEVLKKGKQTNDSIQKKLKVLSEKNMLENIDFENQNDDDPAQGNTQQDNFIDTNSNVNEEKNNVIINHRDNRVTFHSANLNLRSNSSSFGKVILKPKIDTLEYVNKINMEASQHLIVLNKAPNKTEGDANDMNNSFRKSNSEIKNKKIVNKGDSKMIDIYESDLFSQKKAHKQKRDDIALFMLRKKEKDKELATKLEREGNDRSLNILIELAKLNEKTRFHSQQSKNHKKKVKNDLYIGNRSRSQPKVKKSVQSDDSTVIDPNEYYYGILASNKIITPLVGQHNTKHSSKKSGNNNSLIENIQDKKVVQGKEGITKEEFVEFLDNQEHSIKSIQNQASFSKDKSKTKETLKKIHSSLEKEQERNSLNDLSNEKFNQLKNKVLGTIQKANFLLENSKLSEISKKSFVKEIENEEQEKDSNTNTVPDKVDQLRKDNTGQLSIQVPSTIDANNIASLNNKDNDNAYSSDFNERADSEVENHLPTEKDKDTISHQGVYVSESEIPEQDNRYEGVAPVKIDMKAVYHLYELIKYINWRRVFSILIQHYAEVTKFQRYAFGMAYLTAIVKKGPFIAVHNYVNYITYYYALNGLIAPIKRNALQQIWNYSELRGKLYFFCKLLELIMKKRCLTLIYIFCISQEGGEDNNEEEQDENHQILMQQYYDKCKASFTLIIRPHLYEAFHMIMNYSNSGLHLSNSNSEHKKEIDLSQSRKINSESPSSSKLWYNKNEDLEPEDLDKQPSNKISEGNNPIQRHREGSNNEINLSRLSNENSFMQEKMNTYMYESLTEKSIELYPNSFDSHRLHRIHQLIRKQQEMMGASSHHESEHSQNQIIGRKSSDRSLKSDQGPGKRTFPFPLDDNSNNNSFTCKGQSNPKSYKSGNENEISKKEISNRTPTQKNENNNLLLSTSNKFSNIDLEELNNSMDPAIHGKQSPKDNQLDSKGITENKLQQNVNMPDDFLNEKEKQQIKEKKYQEIFNKDIPNVNKKDNEEIIEEIDISDDKKNNNIHNKDRNIITSKDKESSGDPVKHSVSYIKQFEKLLTASEPDISAERDITSDIDWGYQMSGSQRGDHLKDKDSISGSEGSFPKLSSIHKGKEINRNLIQVEVLASEGRTTPEDKEEKLKEDHKEVNYRQEKEEERKESEDAGYDLDEFNNEDDIPEIDDQDENILGIIRNESQNPTGNLIYTNTKDTSQGQGLNSMKSRNQNEKKRIDGNKDNTDHAKEQNGSSMMDDNSHVHNPSDTQIPAIVDQIDNEILLHNNEKIVLDADVFNQDKIEDKITIDVDGNAIGNNDEIPSSARECKSNKAAISENDCKSGSSNAIMPSSIKSIESESGDYFKITGNNNNKIFTINDGSISLTSLANEKDASKDKLSKNNTGSIITKQDNASNNNSSLNTVIRDTNVTQNLLQNSRYEEDNLKSDKVLSDLKKEHEIQLNYDHIAEDITNTILEELLFSEIQDKKRHLIPKKIQKLEKNGEKTDTSLNFLNHSAGSINTSPSHKAGGFLNNPSAVNMIESACSVLNIPATLNNSIFMKTVSELKKEASLNLYNEKIAPKLIQKVSQMVEMNYPLIYEEIQRPLINIPEEVIQALIHRDSYLLKKSYKCLPANSHNVIDKKKLLIEFDVVNRDIRAEDNVTSDNYYDNILNECMLDAANELILKERVYGETGEPLPWINRATRAVKFKYDNSKASKKRLREYLEKGLTGLVNYKMGLITENHEHLDSDQLNQEREKRLMGNINKELNEIEDQWKTFEIEETQIKLELCDLILEQLLNEVVEILEHVQLSRRRSNLYQYKSIFACEDIPRLSFQQYNTENDFDNINQ